MKTFFAAPERTDEKHLTQEIDFVNSNPVMTGLLQSICGLLAILDEHRQLIAINEEFLHTLNIENPSEALGLRLGEAVQCIHAHDEPAGCGTTKYCSTCGAAIAMVSSLEHNIPVERLCSLAANRGGKSIDIALRVRSQPILIDRKRFLLIFLQDVTLQEQRAALERTFFHDINNMLNGIVGASEMLVDELDKSELARILYNASVRMSREIEMQKQLLHNDQPTYRPTLNDTSPIQVMDELKVFYAHHPAAVNKHIDFSTAAPVLSFKTDTSLLLRVLCNMLTNALEATDEQGTVKTWAEQNQAAVSFCVWNDKMIVGEVARRVFQRNFSTKDGAGRGLGTYAMKLFGEKFLGGAVSFTSSMQAGTTFSISIPF